MKQKKETTIQSKTSRLDARVSPQLKNMFTQAARMQGVSLSNFLITSAKKEAENTIKNNKLITLSLSDTELLVRESLKDTKPNEKLKAAAKNFIKHKSSF